MNYKISLVAVLLSVSLISACGTKTPNPPPEPYIPATETAIPITPLPTVTPLIPPLLLPETTPTTTSGSITLDLAKTIPVPASLMRIGLSSENIFMNVKSNNYAKAQDELKKIKEDLNNLNPALKVTPTITTNTISTFNDAISTLETNINSKKQYESMFQANTITRYAYDISDNYKTDYPTDLGRLKVFGREVELALDKNDWSVAANNNGELNAVWTKVKTLFDTTYNSDILAFDTMMSKLGKDIDSKNSSMVRTDLKNIYDKVDVLVSNFIKQKKV